MMKTKAEIREERLSKAEETGYRHGKYGEAMSDLTGCNRDEQKAYKAGWQLGHAFRYKG